MRFRSLITSSVVSLLAVAPLLAQSTHAPAAAPRASAKIPRAPDGHPDLTGIWSNATRTPFERPAVLPEKRPSPTPKPKLGKPEKISAGKKVPKLTGGRPVTIQGGAYNVLFYDNGSELMRIDGQKRTSMVFRSAGRPRSSDSSRKHATGCGAPAISPAITRAFPTTPAVSSATLRPFP